MHTNTMLLADEALTNASERRGLLPESFPAALSRGLLSSTLRQVIVVVAVMFAGEIAAAQAPNLIDITHGTGVGSFEQGDYVESGIGFMHLSTTSTVLTGWTVSGESGVDWLSSPEHYATSGSKSLDLKGTIAGQSGFAFTQIQTTTGSRYRMHFDAYGGAAANSGTVSAGDLQLQLFAPLGVPDPSHATYQHYAYEFTAIGPTTVILFQSGTSDGFGPVIDNVWVGACVNIVQVPEDQTVCATNTCSFSVAAAEQEPLVYAWRKDGVVIDSSITGNPTAATSTLILQGVSSVNAGVFDCVVSNSCGSATSPGALLTVAEECCDSIDFNNDTSLFDPQDIEAFLSVYSEGPCVPASATCGDIDVNNDTSVFDPCDINSFLVIYSEGPCTPCGV